MFTIVLLAHFMIAICMFYVTGSQMFHRKNIQEHGMVKTIRGIFNLSALMTTTLSTLLIFLTSFIQSYIVFYFVISLIITLMIHAILGFFIAYVCKQFPLQLPKEYYPALNDAPYRTSRSIRLQAGLKAHILCWLYSNPSG